MLTARKVHQLAAKFGVTVKRMATAYRGVYRIELSDGRVYCLKRMRYSPSRLRWIDRILQQVRQNGFPLLVWRNPSQKEGKRLFVRSMSGAHPHLLMRWVKGRWPSPKSLKDMRTCAVALANFHKAGQKVAHPRTGALNMFGKWHAVLGQQHRLMENLIRKAKKNGFNRPLDRLLQAHGDEIMRWSNEARQMLRNSNYEAACKQASSTGSLVHGDGGPTNFIINSKGTYLLDFETLRLDLRAFDLYRVIYNSCKDHQWKFRIAQSLLDGYQTVSKLDEDDFELLKVWLRFPRTTFNLLKIYNSRGAGGKSFIEKRLPRALAAERKIGPFLHKLDLYARKAKAE